MIKFMKNPINTNDEKKSRLSTFLALKKQLAKIIGHGSGEW